MRDAYDFDAKSREAQLSAMLVGDFAFESPSNRNAINLYDEKFQNIPTVHFSSVEDSQQNSRPCSWVSPISGLAQPKIFGKYYCFRKHPIFDSGFETVLTQTTAMSGCCWNFGHQNRRRGNHREARHGIWKNHKIDVGEEKKRDQLRGRVLYTPTPRDTDRP
jgi:hypothetical protein